MTPEVALPQVSEGEAAHRSKADYKSKLEPIWCPGCGDFGVLASLYESFARKNLDPKDLVIVSGIGCSSRLPGFVNSYGLHSVHGRTMPISLGVKTANPNLNVVVVGGDGDGYSIGAGHLPHAARRNPDIVYIVMDNEIYGLTKGQASPTSPNKLQTASTPMGNLDDPLNPLAMMISYGTAFVAQGYSGRPKELTDLIGAAMDHKGMSFINVLSPCTTFYNTYKLIPPKLAVIDPTHDPSSAPQAMALALDQSKVWLGVLFKQTRPTYDQRVAANIEAAKSRGVPKIEELFARFH